MPADFHDDLIFFVRCLVPRYNDLSARETLQLIHLRTKRLVMRLQITRLLTFRDRVSNYSKPKQSWIKQRQPGPVGRRVIHWKSIKMNLYLSNTSICHDWTWKYCRFFKVHKCLTSSLEDNWVRFKKQLTVLPPLPMTLPAAVEGTLMCVSSRTSSFPVKIFSSFSFPNIRPWAWNKEEGMRQGETGENRETVIQCFLLYGIKWWIIGHNQSLKLLDYLKLSLWCPGNDNHPLRSIWLFSWGNLTHTRTHTPTHRLLGQLKTTGHFHYKCFLTGSIGPAVGTGNLTLIDAPAKWASCLMCWPFLPIRAPTAWVGIKRQATSCSWAWKKQHTKSKSSVTELYKIHPQRWCEEPWSADISAASRKTYRVLVGDGTCWRDPVQAAEMWGVTLEIEQQSDPSSRDAICTYAIHAFHYMLHIYSSIHLEGTGGKA